MTSAPGMHNMLSASQLAGLASTINTGGGFSVQAVGPGAGTKASDGYMVGIAGQQKDFPPNQNITPDDIGEFIVDRGDVLSAPGMHIGGWQGSSPTRASVDVSQKFPRTEAGLEGARFAAAASNQEGIGEVDASANYAGTLDNPYYNYPAGQKAPRDMVTLFEADWAASGNVDPVAQSIVTAAPNFPRITRGQRRRR
jgi:hypothetical protein